MCLCVSGGTTAIVDVRSYTEMEVLGATRDDAAGECFDKVARVLGIGYPGGAPMDRLADGGDDRKYELPRAHVQGAELDMSFSGLKTASLNLIHNAQQKGEELDLPSFAASFGRAVSESLVPLGIMSSQEALRMAEERDLDLVKISPNAVPPVCKLMDYGKFRFEQTKREKEARKNQRVVEIKEIRMSPSIDVNDFNVKLRNAQKFLSDGNRCKITVRFRGREMAHTNIGQDLLVKFAESCGEVAVMDKSRSWRGATCLSSSRPSPQRMRKSK